VIFVAVTFVAVFDHSLKEPKMKKSMLTLALISAAPLAFAQNQAVLGALNGFSDNNTQREVNRAVAILCPAGNRLTDRLQADCNALVGAAFRQNTNVRDAIRQLTPDSAPVSVNRALAQLGSIGANAGTASSAFFGEKTGPGGSPFSGMVSWANDVEGSNWSLFGSLESRSSDRDASSNMDGFDSDRNGATLGALYRLTSESNIGLALRYRDGELNFTGGSGGQDQRDLGFTALYSYAGESPWHFDAQVTRINRDTDQVRNTRYTLDATTSVDQRYFSEFDTSLQNASATLGYVFAADSWQWNPYAQVEFRKQSADGYDERALNPTANGAGWAIRTADQDQNDTLLTIGLRASVASSQDWGVLQPFADVAFVSVNDDDENTQLSFVGDTSAARERFFAFNDVEDDSYGQVSIGVSAQWRSGFAGFLRYSQNFSESRFEQRGVHLGFNWAF
jgi:uncharacterized protein YhjY with autotransporter beta-barrel domain